MRAFVRRRSIVVAITVAAAIAGGLAVALACGPDLVDLVTVAAIDPAYPERYAAGDVGVVRPHFRRRHLLQAYRVLSGRPPLRIAPKADPPPGAAVKEWLQIARIRSEDFSQSRYMPSSYSDIPNCTDDAVALAVQTYHARAAQYGAASTQIRDWVAAQTAVFKNCSDANLTLPPPAPAGSDRLVQSDRAYQTAAAYFYAMQYGEAEKRFRAIGADTESAWRPFGRFLAARALIRAATTESMPNDPDEERQHALVERFRTADADLRAVLADRSAGALHASARRLRAFLAARLRPVERLHELTAILARAPVVESQDLTDYVWLMDRLVGDTVEYSLTPSRRDEIASGDGFTQWVLAMQDAAFDVDQALAVWRSERSPAWLAAVLWRVPAGHASAAELLRAAEDLPRESSAFATIAFLRVRLLAAQGRADEARSVLATLPATPGDGVSAESLNLFKAQRMQLARSLDELLANAPREWVVDHDPKQPVFDTDAARAFTHLLPLDQLVASVESSLLPPRLRMRVAAAAFARAVVLEQDPQGVRAATVLASLSPAMQDDLQGYINAPDSVARHHAALMALLRTPGLHPYVSGLDDDFTIKQREPNRAFDHLFRRNWWCERAGPSYEPDASEATQLVYAGERLPPTPSFLSDAERTQVAAQRQALDRLPTGNEYLAMKVLAWARAEPRNPAVAEALAHVVEGWRWGCAPENKWPLAREAFQTLHRNFPQSDWAKRTRYWYRD